jgi:hypothetical protein
LQTQTQTIAALETHQPRCIRCATVPAATVWQDERLDLSQLAVRELLIVAGGAAVIWIAGVLPFIAIGISINHTP